ncbi:hypothetical protein [Pseudoalteromonas sp. T1lg88]|uniref:hypothetical protein n=1 Tax=Pseudoalteromonas sp. T1lg88 TaxID=2077104 RepID=UPI001319DAF3|nr:hypothetical protein [Pseudoalteromonas sp. T1lg88]
MSEIRYPYKPKLFVAILCILFFGIFSYFTGQVASENDRGLILNRVIEFSATGASIFYWAITGLFGVLSILGAVLLFKGVTSKNELVLTDEYIQAPKSGISNKIVTVKYENIENITEQKVQKNLFLNIFHDGGKLTLVSSVLPKKEDFEYVKSHIVSRINC